MTRRAGLDQDTDLIAAEWAVRRAEGLEPHERAEFDEWLGDDPANWRAYKETSRVWGDLAEMDLRAAERKIEAGRRRRAPVWAAIAATLVAGLIGVQAIRAAPDKVYESERGEVRTVRLQDGSHVTLGAGSAIAVNFERNGRHVVLRRGEALFDVTHDPSRPFDVRAADTQVRVVGTRFVVKSAPEAVRVDVIQGIVRVAKTENPLLAPFIAAPAAEKIVRGQRLESPRGEDLKPLPDVDPAEAAPWTHGRLVYENASLAEVVADLNRYSTGGVELTSKELGELRVTAALSQDQVSQFVTSLPATLPVQVHRQADGRIEISPAA